MHTEISRAAGREPTCQTILTATWLGEPVEPSIEEFEKVYELQVALNDGRRPPQDDRGEAESIFFAEKHSGTFLTDDNGAFDFAERRLGRGRVVDSIYVLQTAVANGDLSARDAAQIANDIEGAERHFRRCHRPPFTHTMF